jgi:DNA repair protein RadA/Sms
VSAVVDRAFDLGLSRSELFGASSGGLYIDEPGADLAVAAAVASAARGRPVPPGMAFIGELSLTGIIRPVPGMEARLSAAASAGLTEVVVPQGSPLPPKTSPGPRVTQARHVLEALGWGRSGPVERRSVRAK